MRLAPDRAVTVVGGSFVATDVRRPAVQWLPIDIRSSVVGEGLLAALPLTLNTYRCSPFAFIALCSGCIEVWPLDG
jgi:hypothetical protein